MEILFIGDIVGKPGRDLVLSLLPDLIDEYGLDFVIANGENVTHGKGLSKEHMLELLEAGVDAITLGNHAFAKKDIFTYIDDYEELIRPYNLHNAFPGRGTSIFDVNGKKIRVTNLLGRVYMGMNVENPFDCLKHIVDKEEKVDIHIVDFHAEATGEKLALGWAMDGLVSAVLGTHTHVQTSDARLLSNGTAYISDVGMCGPRNGILGCQKEGVIKKTWTGYPFTFEVLIDNDVTFSGVVLSIDDYTNKVTKITPIQKNILL